MSTRIKGFERVIGVTPVWPDPKKSAGQNRHRAEPGWKTRDRNQGLEAQMTRNSGGYCKRPHVCRRGDQVLQKCMLLGV
jgi:hypothetical protein